MTLYGYARVSVREPEDKNLDLQVERLVRAGCAMGNVRAEEASGAKNDGGGRPCTTNANSRSKNFCCTANRLQPSTSPDRKPRTEPTRRLLPEDRVNIYTGLI